MGPTTAALLQLYRADQALREAQVRLDAVTKDVRIQETRSTQVNNQLQAAQAKLRELQAKSANFELDLKVREEQIEKLRNQQQLAPNNKEYQALLVEINTRKVDRAKVEETAIKTMEQVEQAQTEVTNLTASAGSDQAKLESMRAAVGDKAAAAKAEVDKLLPAREEAAAKIKPSLVEQFTKLADRYDGEAMAAIDQPNPRDEEYLCTGCNMSLVADVYNKLKVRDDVVTCPSCRRILFVPEKMASEPVTVKKTSSRGKSDRKVMKIAKPIDQSQPENKWQSLVTGAQGESVEGARDADQRPVECIVEINGETVGVFKGKSAEHLERVIRFRMEEKKMVADVKVTNSAAMTSPATETATESAAPANGAEPTA